MCYRDLVFMNGALYFIIQMNLLSRFDVKELHAWTIKLPEKEKFKYCQTYQKIWRSSFFYSAYSFSKTHIWMLQSFETGEWILKHTILKENIEKHPIAVIPNPPYCYPFVLYPLTFHPDLEFLFIEIQGKILSYHFGS